LGAGVEGVGEAFVVDDEGGLAFGGEPDFHVVPSVVPVAGWLSGVREGRAVRKVGVPPLV
jgi:hypothetical protein